NPSYEVYREFTKRHFQARYKVHELIGARLKMENQKKQRAAEDHLTDDARDREGEFFKRLFGRRSHSSRACEASWSQARRGAWRRGAVEAFADRHAMHAASAYHASDFAPAQSCAGLTRASILFVQKSLRRWRERGCEVSRYASALSV